MGFGNFKCIDCGIDTSDLNEYYGLNGDVWAEAGYEIDVMACVGCVEIRLQRDLKPEDFMNCYINDRRNRTNPNRSMRLSSRMGLI